MVDGGDGEVRPGLGVNGVGWLTRDVVAVASNVWDRYVIDLARERAWAGPRAVAATSSGSMQNGLVQHYALA